MGIYEITTDGIKPLAQTTFQAAKLTERGDLQRMLRENIAVVSPDTLVIAEEFSEWEDAYRRIDLLGIDKRGNLVVVELKRGETGGHMELQALRYAAMVSAMTLERVTDVFGRYLKQRGRDGDAEAILREFLDLEVDEAAEDQIAQDVRIVLAAAAFGKELTTCVLWLNDRGLDIRCVRLRPYADGKRVLLDVQQVIPLPESEQYQVKLQEKAQKERMSRKSGRDYTKFDVTVNGKVYERLSKAQAAYQLACGLCENGIKPEQIAKAASFRQSNTFRMVPGEVSEESVFIEKALAQARAEGRVFDEKRYFTTDDRLFHADGKTYVLSNQWGGRAEQWLTEVMEAFPDKGVSFKRHEDTP